MATVLKTRIHTGVLSRLFPRTAASVKRELQGERIWKDNDWMSLNVGSLPYVVEQELRKALPELEKAPEYAPKPDTSMQENAEYNRKVMEDVAKQGAIIKRQQEIIDSGHAQMALYQKIGLVDNQRNSDLIAEHIRNNGGIFCAVSVRAAVESCRQNLVWKKVEPPTEAPPPPSEQDLLPNGEPRLKLGTTPNRHHSIAQLRDLDARERKTRGRQQGTFGSKF